MLALAVASDGHHADVDSAPVPLREVMVIARVAADVVARFEQDVASGLRGVKVHHIGATAMPFGHTKGDVDVNVRVGEDTFLEVVATLRSRYEIAQPENWTSTYASFATDRYALPLGIQVTVIGSADDFLVSLRDRMRADPYLLRRYDECKVRAAPRGATAYWEAKHEFLREIVASSDSASRASRFRA